MSQKNQTDITTVTEFFIVGFPGLQPEYYNLMGTIFLIIYCIILLENFIFVLLFANEPSLYKPMYLIMINLAVSDIGFCTVALPKIISRYLFNNGFISFNVCFLQRQLIHYFGTLNSLIMMIMALDRYLAICFPLRYSVFMSVRTMWFLSGFSWVSSMICPSISTSLTAKMPFCGPNLIINCYCDTLSMNNLACTDTRASYQVQFSLAMFVLLVPFSFIIFTYISIVVAVIRIKNNQGRMKAFSTCGTQLFIISLYYAPRLFVYTTPFIPNFKITVDERMTFTMVYSLLPPLVNPFIYCFRSKEIQVLFFKWCLRKKITNKIINVNVNE
ncbi:odorant receptor 104-1 [Trichomycterus rosablanca]|uniref:odorant receptor 104-1 n=1 Tax=Trichomycterus rosablanca TaxID=2290929 RepID=UPI002F357E9E